MFNHTDLFLNTTTPTNSTANTIPAYVGFISLIVTVVFYGSFLLPVKKIETGDGLFFQMIQCIGIWSVSIVVNWIRNFPKFYALPMVCGLLWSSNKLIYCQHQAIL